jgi:hypothetical protein
VTIKVLLKAACDSKIVPKADQECTHWRKSTNESKEKPEQKLDEAFE